MPSTIEHIVRLVLKASGGEALGQIREQAGYTRKSLEQLHATYDEGGLSKAKFTAHAGRLRAELEKLERAEAALTAAEAKAAAANVATTAGLDATTRSADRAADAKGRLGRAGVNAGYGIMLVSQAIDDMQYRIDYAANNIPGIIMAFGGPAGLAAGASLAATALTVAARNMALFSTQTDTAKTGVERLKERIAELEEKPIKLAVDRAELAAAEEDLRHLTEAQEAYNEAKGLKSKAQRDGEAAAKEALSADPGAADALRRSIHARKVESDPAIDAEKLRLAGLQARRAELQRQLADPAEPGKFRAQREGELRQLDRFLIPKQEKALSDTSIARRQAIGGPDGEAAKAAGDLLKPAMGRSAPGELAADLEKLADALDGIGKADLAEQLRDATPDSMKRQAEQVAGLKKWGRARKEAEDEAKREREAEDEKSESEPERTGRETAAARRRLREKREDAAAKKKLRDLEDAKTKEEAARAAQKKTDEREALLGDPALEARAGALIDAASKAKKGGVGRDFAATDEKAREMADARVDEDIRRSTYRRLVNAGVDAGKAEEMADAAPRFYRDKARQAAANRGAGMAGNGFRNVGVGPAPVGAGGAGSDVVEGLEKAAAAGERLAGASAALGAGLNGRLAQALARIDRLEAVSRSFEAWAKTTMNTGQRRGHP